MPLDAGLQGYILRNRTQLLRTDLLFKLSFFVQKFTYPDKGVVASLVEEFEGHYLYIARSKYGHFIAEAVCNRAPLTSFQSFYGEVVTHSEDLVNHIYGNNVISKLIRRTKTEKSMHLDCGLEDYIMINRNFHLRTEFGKYFVFTFEV
ncbi:unnamed protein product [Arabis nemorensis]|uniref:PUM-HD domain-containing protein n=1 Tax=Arabis nemorensis TaxID=586526 RepID=A0A565BAX8_9BRAS|nr:unnamed protein product [Arabis nemorensis]